MSTEAELRQRILSKLANYAALKAGPQIEAASRTLRDSLKIVLVSDTQAKLSIPQYWAVYVHDGQQGEFIEPRRGGHAKYLAWFRNPAEDPRLQPNAPVRYSDVKFLRQVWSKAEFREALATGRLVLAKRRPTAKPKKFFEEGLAGLDQEVGPIVAAEFSAFMSEFAKKQKGSVTFRL